MNKTLLNAGLALTASLTSVVTLAGPHSSYSAQGHTRVAVAPAPVVTAPVARQGHAHGHHHGYRPGYWSNGRWIAPVVIGAALLGTAAYASTYYLPPPAVTYVNPAPVTYVTPATHVQTTSCDLFCQADRDQNGVIDRVEASFDPAWSRWFNDMDANRDGMITRQELDMWNSRRAIPSSSVLPSVPALPALPPLPPVPALPLPRAY